MPPPERDRPGRLAVPRRGRGEMQHRRSRRARARRLPRILGRRQPLARGALGLRQPLAVTTVSLVRGAKVEATFGRCRRVLGGLPRLPAFSVHGASWRSQSIAITISFVCFVSGTMRESTESNHARAFSPTSSDGRADPNLKTAHGERSTRYRQVGLRQPMGTKSLSLPVLPETPPNLPLRKSGSIKASP